IPDVYLRAVHRRQDEIEVGVGGRQGRIGRRQGRWRQRTHLFGQGVDGDGWHRCADRAKNLIRDRNPLSIHQIHVAESEWDSCVSRSEVSSPWSKLQFVGGAASALSVALRKLLMPLWTQMPTAPRESRTTSFKVSLARTSEATSSSTVGWSSTVTANLWPST